MFLFFLLAFGKSIAQENASNPLAATNNTDLRAQFLDLGEPYLNDFWIDGAFMATDKLKLKYEVHYWNSDVRGKSQNGFESFHFKPIYFPLAGEWGEWKYRLAVGIEWILEFGNPDSGNCKEETELCVPPGTGSDQLAPLAGLSLVAPKGTVFIPLLQQFFSYNGRNVNITAGRLIAIQSFAKGAWGKLDVIVPFDWENDVVPATAEIQFGKMFSSRIGAYVDGMVGVGGDRPYNWGVGVGLRWSY
jgi:hypothetical protein